MKQIKLLPEGFEIRSIENSLLDIYYFGRRIPRKPFKSKQNALKWIEEYSLLLSVGLEYKMNYISNKEKEKALKSSEFIKKTVNNDKRILDLRKRIESSIESSNLTKVFSLQQDLKILFSKIEREVTIKLDIQRNTLVETITPLPKEDQFRTLVYLHSFIFLADLLETSNIRLNNKLALLNSNYKIGLFNDLIKLSKEVKNSLHFLFDIVSEEYQLSFAETSDEITESFYCQVADFLEKYNNV